MGDISCKVNRLSWIDLIARFYGVLAEDGRISITDLAQRIGLSKSPTQARLRRLEKDRVITGYRALYDPIRLGLDHVSFVEVRLNDTREAALAEFNAAVRKIPEIEQVHMIAGNFDYLLKVRTQDMTDYRDRFGREDFDAAACGRHLDLCGDAGDQGKHAGRCDLIFAGSVPVLRA